MNYCDSCTKYKQNIQAKQQVINRLRQTGSATEGIEQAESEKAEIEAELQAHKEESRQSLVMYKDMLVKCSKGWKEIKELEEVLYY